MYLSDGLPHGATGFLGGAFLADLLQSSYDGEVVCLVWADDDDTRRGAHSPLISRFTTGRFTTTRFTTSYTLPKNVKVLRGDLLSNDWHDSPFLDGVKHVLHLAASTSFGNSRGIRTTNVGGALRLPRPCAGAALNGLCIRALLRFAEPLLIRWSTKTIFPVSAPLT